MNEPELYIHGFSEAEQKRLIEQNEVLAPYIYAKSDYSAVKHLVEIGCGVGAQMMTLLNRYPHLNITGLESSPKQLARAKINLDHFPSFKNRFTLMEGDALSLLPKFNTAPDAALIVWVLEHVQHPQELLTHIKSWLPTHCPLFITEVFHSSFNIWPQLPGIMPYWEDTLRCQRRLGGDPDIGLQLGNLLEDAGFHSILTWPHVFYLDNQKPIERDMLLNYWLDLMRSAFHATLAAGETTLERWQMAEHSMQQLISMKETVFYYSFIQATASV